MKTTLMAAIAAVSIAVPAFADIKVEDAYARSSGPAAKAGAAFMILQNSGDTDDTLIGATSPAAKRVELHTHLEEDGVMKMRKLEDGMLIPAGEMHMLKRGGDHVMFMGLTGPWAQGDMVLVTLIFEKAGEMQVEIPVDLDRKPEHGGHGSHDN